MGTRVRTSALILFRCQQGYCAALEQLWDASEIQTGWPISSSVLLCTPSHRLLRARVSLWLWPLRQLHTARSQFNPQRHQRSNTLKQVQCTMYIGKRSANRGADSEKQIWHLGHSQLRASTLTPRPLCTGYAVPSLFTRKVLFILSRCQLLLPHTV